MKNNKAHLHIPGIILKVIIVGSAAWITFLLAIGKTVPTNAIFAFAILMFFSQFVNMMFGMNPIGMISGMFVALFALIMVKAVYSYPSTAFGKFFINNLIFIAPTFAVIDIIRDIID